MNEKRAKKLRKIVAKFDVGTPTVTTHTVMMADMKTTYQVVNPIRYPEGSRRQLYQAAKKSVRFLHL